MENACVHTAHALHAGYGLLNPNSHPVLSPRGRELERGQQTARFLLGRLELGCWGRLPKFGEVPLPSPPPRGRGWIAADFAVAGRLKKNARNINGRNFSGSLYRKTDGTNAAKVFSDDLSTQVVGCVPHIPYIRATAYFLGDINVDIFRT